MKNKIISTLDKVEKGTLVIVFITMVIAIFIQVINRNWLYLPLSWLEELAVYCMVYMVLLGTELGLRDDTQVRMTLILDKLSDKAKSVINIIVKLFVVFFAILTFFASINILGMQIQTLQTSAALNLPMLIPYSAFAISFAIIIIVQTTSLFKMIINFNNHNYS
ncbi:TRAP transporter small permease [Oceanobacillus jeddahense]|uniref:TRAP transporter small permease n=1 Tax=Oceanobacillus jeddahense TaxID=1462527 RepID=UPI000595D810|nr:TRAP transporter small permease [Oceanobacillus jeddahense]